MTTTAATQRQTQTQATTPQNPQGNEVVKTELAMSERFTNTVLREFGSNVAGAIQVTDYQRQLIQGYFIAIDRALKLAEEARIRKNENNKDPKYNNNLPVTWNNVNLNDLALDVVHYARMGLDMMQDNHLFPIPYKNNKTNKYDITLMPGYNGIQYIAEKYAVETPQAVTIELVYSTDTFKPIKKSKDNKIESYEFEINNAFDRGEVVGGFGYIEYADPLKNKLVIMTKKDIEKRKPAYASAEFWGGTTKVWENGKQVEKETDGWYEEMCLKTLKREVYSAKYIPRDPKKIDDAYQYMKMREARYAEIEVQNEIDQNANTILIDSAPAQLPERATVDTETGEVLNFTDKTEQPQHAPSPEKTAANSAKTAKAEQYQLNLSGQPHLLMEIKVFASGSSGNAYLVSDEKTTLLLDAGIPLREIQIACGFKVRLIDGCLISHAHKDHSKAAEGLAKLGVDIYTSQGTIDACKLVGHRMHAVKALQEFTIGTFKVLPFDVQHDAPEPLGFLIKSTATRERLLYFTDSYYIKYRFAGLTHIMAECNYSKEALLRSIEAGYIPIELVPRLVKSHMSLEHFLEMLKANDLKEVRQIYLLHLSDNNSDEEKFREEVQKATGAEVYVC